MHVAVFDSSSFVQYANINTTRFIVHGCRLNALLNAIPSSDVAVCSGLDKNSIWIYVAASDGCYYDDF